MSKPVTLKLGRSASLNISQVGTEAAVTIHTVALRELGCVSSAELHLFARKIEALACTLDVAKMALRMVH